MVLFLSLSFLSSRTSFSKLMIWHCAVSRSFSSYSIAFLEGASTGGMGSESEAAGFAAFLALKISMSFS